MLIKNGVMDAIESVTADYFYRNYDRTVEVVFDKPLFPSRIGNAPIMAKINWACVGSVSTEEASFFAEGIEKAISIAQEFNSKRFKESVEEYLTDDEYFELKESIRKQMDESGGFSVIPDLAKWDFGWG